MKKVILTGVAFLMTASSAMASYNYISDDAVGIEFEDIAFQNYIEAGQSADDYVRDHEGWGFTTIYEKAKADLWGDSCDFYETAKGCSDKLTQDWELQHAAAYIMADLVQNRGVEYKYAKEYVNILTVPGDRWSYNTDHIIWHAVDDEVWDIDNAEDLIDEYLNPTSHEFGKYMLFGLTDTGWYSSHDFIHGGDFYTTNH